MNILIFSWRGPGHPNAGGAEKSTHEHAKIWVKAGHEVTLFTSSYPGAKSNEKIDGVNIKRAGIQIFGVQLEAFKWYIFSNKQKFDLVIDQFHGIPFFTPLYIKTKKLGFIHEVTKEVWVLNSWPKPFNLIPAVLGTLFESSIFKLFYRNIPFMTVSESTKTDLVKWGIPKEKITVIHNGINIPKIKILPTKEKEKTLIFLGALSKDKGIEDAIKVFSIINRKEKNWQFWIVGKSDSRYLSELKVLAEKLFLKGKVKFWGFVGEEEKIRLLSRAHILINPSIREGWGLVVIEAASVGTPTVAYYNVAGLRDSIISGRTGILSRFHSVESLEQEIMDLINNKDKYNSICKNAISWSKEFSWEKSTKISLKLINDLVG